MSFWHRARTEVTGGMSIGKIIQNECIESYKFPAGLLKEQPHQKLSFLQAEGYSATYWLHTLPSS